MPRFKTSPIAVRSVLGRTVSAFDQPVMQEVKAFA